jgi:branched-chain amino acid transport system permease protein
VRRRPRALLAYVAAAAVLAGVGPLLGGYGQYVFSLWYVLLAAALAWNLMAGYGGLFSLGNQALSGVGGYALTVLLIHVNVPWSAAVVAGGLFAVATAAVLLLPLLRLRDEYFAIGSLIMALAVHAWMANWNYVGAVAGLDVPVVPSVLAQYEAALIVALATLVAVEVVLMSPLGAMLQAIRDDEEAAVSSGVDVTRTKASAILVAAFFTGMVGGLQATQLISIQPDSMFDPAMAIQLVAVSMIGGIATVPGPIVGAMIVVALNQAFQSLGSLAAVIDAAILIAIVRVAPGGLMELFRRGLARLFPPPAASLDSDEEVAG